MRREGNPMIKAVSALVGLAVALVGPQARAADDFPSRPVSLMMPYAAGGPGDTITRVIASGMSKALGRQFVVENTAGAGGTIGTAKVAASPPDGYSLLVMHFGHAANVALYRNLRYDAVKDFEPIGMVAESPMAIVARKDFPPATLKDLIAYVKSGKEKVTAGQAGIGSASHLCELLFLSAIQGSVTTIPYKGTGPALNDLIGGQFDFMCDQTLNVMQPVKAGMLKAYAATTRERLAVMQELPTATEAGLPGFEITVWFAMYAPKGTPQPVIDKLSAALREALQDPDVKARLSSAGADTVAPERGRPEALRAHLQAEIDKWVPIIQKAGIYAD
jgi:tripartite-type tricarboxylate transporter receptor subunit TctC